MRPLWTAIISASVLLTCAAAKPHAPRHQGRSFGAHAVNVTYWTYHWFSRVYKCLELSTIRIVAMLCFPRVDDSPHALRPKVLARIKCTALAVALVSFSVIQCVNLLKSFYVLESVDAPTLQEDSKRVQATVPSFPVPCIAKYLGDRVFHNVYIFSHFFHIIMIYIYNIYR